MPVKAGLKIVISREACRKQSHPHLLIMWPAKVPTAFHKDNV